MNAFQENLKMSILGHFWNVCTEIWTGQEFPKIELCVNLKPLNDALTFSKVNRKNE